MAAKTKGPPGKIREMPGPQAGNIPAAIKSRKKLIDDLLSGIQERLNKEKPKVTLADFIRLIQLQRELEQEEQPAEVIVTWRDLSERQNGGK
jgi:hypothetical protein